MDDSNPPEIATHHQNFVILHMLRTHIHTYLLVGFQSRVCIHNKAMDVFALLLGSPSYIVAFLAHLSRRLTGELIGYPWIRRPSSSVRRPFTFSNIFSSETAWPIKAKFYVKPPWEGGTKVCINGPGHMTKMAAMPIYGKNLQKSSSPEPAGRFP